MTSTPTTNPSDNFCDHRRHFEPQESIKKAWGPPGVTFLARKDNPFFHTTYPAGDFLTTRNLTTLADDNPACDYCEAIGVRKRLLEYRYSSDHTWGNLKLDPGVDGAGNANGVDIFVSGGGKIKIPSPNQWPSPPTDGTINTTALTAGYDGCEAYLQANPASTADAPLTPFRDPGTFNGKTVNRPGIPALPGSATYTTRPYPMTFHINSDMNGETYHGLIAAVRNPKLCRFC